VRREEPDDVGPLTAPGGGQGFTVRDPQLPQPVHIFQRAGRVVAAYGDAAARDALRPSRKLSESSSFRDAAASLGEGFSVSTYLAVKPLFRLIENEAGDFRVAQARPYVEPLGALVAGARRDGDRLESRLRVTIP
jgi:hypothetical protein